MDLFWSWSEISLCYCFIALHVYFQAGWKENHATFMCELKNLQASGLTTLGHALRAAFDLLNLNRLVSGIDNYGQVCNSLSCRSLRNSLIYHIK